MTYSVYLDIPEDGEPSFQVVGNAPKGRYSITGHLHNPENPDAGDMLNVSVPNGGQVWASFPQIASREPTLK